MGFNPESQPLWSDHWAVYWGLTQKVYRLEFDPEYTGYTCSGAGPSCVMPPALAVPPTDPDATYDYRQRVSSLVAGWAGPRGVGDKWQAAAVRGSPSA